MTGLLGQMRPCPYHVSKARCVAQSSLLRRMCSARIWLLSYCLQGLLRQLLRVLVGELRQVFYLGNSPVKVPRRVSHACCFLFSWQLFEDYAPKTKPLPICSRPARQMAVNCKSPPLQPRLGSLDGRLAFSSRTITSCTALCIDVTSRVAQALSTDAVWRGAC